jgi:hypothetical protein
MGPPIHGSSYELVDLKVRQGLYPKGYKPKRSSNIMPKFPNLTDKEIKILHEYLNK